MTATAVEEWTSSYSPTVPSEPRCLRARRRICAGIASPALHRRRRRRVPAMLQRLQSRSCGGRDDREGERGGARMKRDMDLVREIMVKIEALPPGPPVLYRMGEVEDLVLLNHLEMRIEAGLVRGKISRSQGARGDVIGISSLTWEGHEWIDVV